MSFDQSAALGSPRAPSGDWSDAGLDAEFADWLENGPPPRRSPDLDEFDDAVDEALFEAQVCSDLGYADRVLGSWAGYPGFDLDVIAGLDAPEPSSEGGRPADPFESIGRVEWLRRCAEERNRSHARFLAAVHQTGHARMLQDARGVPQRDPFALDEVGAALRHSTSMAGSLLSLAEGVIEKVPRLHAAMEDGRLDLAKATVFVESTRDMPRDLAAAATAAVLPGVEDMANAEIRDRLDVAAGQLDPDWFRRREEAARLRARVEWKHHRDGTGDVALRDIGAPAVAATKARVDALAEPLRRAARAKGLALGLPALRALVCQRLLEGTHVGADDDTLIERLIAELPAWHAELNGLPEPDDPDPEPDDPDHGGPDDSGPEGLGPDAGGGAEPPVARLGTVEVRMRLSTALGRDDLPAELPGTGPVPARRARRLLSAAREGDIPSEWRLVLVDEDGRLEYVLLARPDPPTRARQRRSDRTARSVRGSRIVELTAPTAMLAALDPVRYPAWAGLSSASSSVDRLGRSPSTRARQRRHDPLGTWRRRVTGRPRSAAPVLSARLRGGAGPEVSRSRRGRSRRRRRPRRPGDGAARARG